VAGDWPKATGKIEIVSSNEAGRIFEENRIMENEASSVRERIPFLSQRRRLCHPESGGCRTRDLPQDVVIALETSDA
jgi:hypothetical protein